MFEIACLFHDGCNDVLHVVASVVAVVAAILALCGLVAFIFWIGSCVEHTSECNAFSQDNYRRYSELAMRLEKLESRCVKRA